MNRIMILGSGGAGKSTLARRLSERLQIDVIYLDQYYWKEHWVESTKEEFKKNVQQLVEKEQWIMDGNYASTLAERLKHVDQIIFLDTPNWKCLFRIYKRYFQYRGRTREGMTKNCPERVDLIFAHYILIYPLVHKPRVFKMIKEYNAFDKLVILKNNKDIDKYLAQV